MAERAAPATSANAELPSLASTTLVLVGHGSHRSARSANPIHTHADRLRDRGVAAAVRTAFWKGEPSPREVLRTVPTDDAVVVPVFMAAGYFTEEVLPRELGLTGETTIDVAGSLGYAAPVGTHPAVTDVVVERAERLVENRLANDQAAVDRPGDDGPAVDDRPGTGVGLAVVGHGTDRNPHSAAAARDHATRIREAGRFQEVRALYLDESPSVESLPAHFEADDVVVVPLFVADGPHTRTDVPAAIGLTDPTICDDSAGGDRHGRSRNGDRPAPTELNGTLVRYAGAVGTDPTIVDVILDRGREAVASDVERSVETDRRPPNSATRRPDATGPETEPAERRPETEEGRAFLRWIDAAASKPDSNDEEQGAGSSSGEPTERVTRTWGQLWIAATRDADGTRRYEVRHEADRDADASALEDLDDHRSLRDRARVDDAGRVRSLRSAPTLPAGWRLAGLVGAALVRAVESVYPATIENWHRVQADDLDVSHFRETADRQTGRYASLRHLEINDVAAVAENWCVDEACLKRRRWEFDAGDALDVPPGDGRLPCRAPCSRVLEAAHEHAPDAEVIDS